VYTFFWATLYKFVHLSSYFTSHALNESIRIKPTPESFKEFITNINFFTKILAQSANQNAPVILTGN